MSRRYPICQLVGWSLYAVGVAVPYLMKGQIAPGKMIPYVVALGGAGVAQTHALRAYARRHGWPKLDALRLAPRVVVTSALMGAVMNLVMTIADIYWFRHARWSDVALAWQLLAWLWWFFPVFIGWQTIYFAVQFVRRARKAELEQWILKAEAQAAELRFLKAQLNPHFLFNALNSIRALIAEDPERAQTMVTQLSHFLRHSLGSAQGTVPLERELEVVNDYLAIESIRLEDRLKVSLDIDPASLALPVPPMLVQGLVENSIKHGIALLPSGGELAISARVGGDGLDLRVTNPTAPPRANRPEPSGIGLANTRERLRLLFGERALLALEENAAKTTARVLIPRTAP